MFEELRELTSPFGVLLKQAIEDRIEERRTNRLMELSTLLAYLEDRNFLTTTHDKILLYADKRDIAKVARDLYMRLFPVNEQPDSSVQAPEPTEDVTVEGPTPPKRSLSQKWKEREAMYETSRKTDSNPRPVSALSSANLLKEINKDMKEYEKSGQRSDMLEQVNDK